MKISSSDSVASSTRADGGTLHIHGNVNDSDEARWLENVVESISSIATTHGTTVSCTFQLVPSISILFFEILNICPCTPWAVIVSQDSLGKCLWSMSNASNGMGRTFDMW